MVRCVWWVALSAGLIGCRAPAPSLDVLAPYGSAVVPPPGTGTVGTLGNYYGAPKAGAAAPPATPPGNLLPPPSAVPPGIAPVAPSGVAPASYQSDARGVIAPLSGVSHGSRDRPPADSFADPAVEAANPLRLNGMPVNDATVYEEPSSAAGAAVLPVAPPASGAWQAR